MIHLAIVARPYFHAIAHGEKTYELRLSSRRNPALLAESGDTLLIKCKGKPLALSTSIVSIERFPNTDNSIKSDLLRRFPEATDYIQSKNKITSAAIVHLGEISYLWDTSSHRFNVGLCFAGWIHHFADCVPTGFSPISSNPLASS